MKIEMKNIEEIIPYENNPRINENGIQELANSIKSFGFRNPILIDENNIIIAGHTRLLASKKLGLKEVPTIKIIDLNDDKVKAFRLVDNKVGELSEWDAEKLELELRSIEMDLSSLFAEEEKFESMNDDKLDTPIDKEHFLKIDDERIFLTVEEYKELTELLNDYIDENGTSYGFVKSIML